MLLPFDIKTLRFQTVPFGNDGIAEYIVLRTYLSGVLGKEHADAICDEVNAVFKNQPMLKDSTPITFSVVKSRSTGRFTLQADKTFPLDKEGEAKETANLLSDHISQTTTPRIKNDTRPTSTGDLQL